MRIAEQLTIEPQLACATDRFRAVTPLDSNRNPFTSGALGARIGRPAQTAFGELVRLIGLRTRVVVVLGKAGTGKTVLVGMVARACADMGLSVRRIERGDLLAEAAGDESDVLFVDEADSMSNTVLQSFLSASESHAERTMVFMCLPSCIGRFSFPKNEAAVLELSPLSLSDARLYLTERGNSIGRPNLFTPQALDLVVDASAGVPRLLRSIAGHAYFNAAAEGASQIDATHSEAAARMRTELGPVPSGASSALFACSETARIDNRPANADTVLVEESAEAADAAEANEPPTLLHTEIFDETEAAREGESFWTRKSIVALGIVLLIAGAGAFALMNGHNPRNREPQEASRSPAIAIARPAEVAAPKPSSERATPTIEAPTQSASETASVPTERASAAEPAPIQPAPASNAASTNIVSPPPATKTETEDASICAFLQLSRDPKALPVAGRCPGAQRAVPATTAIGSTPPPPIPRAAIIYSPTQPKSAVPAIDATAAARSAPAEPVRAPVSTQAQTPIEVLGPPAMLRPNPPAVAADKVQNPIEVPAPPAMLRPNPPAVAADKVPTQDVRENARPAQGAAEQKAAPPLEPDDGSIVIFGFRLW